MPPGFSFTHFFGWEIFSALSHLRRLPLSNHRRIFFMTKLFSALSHWVPPTLSLNLLMHVFVDLTFFTWSPFCANSHSKLYDAFCWRSNVFCIFSSVLIPTLHSFTHISGDTKFQTFQRCYQEDTSLEKFSKFQNVGPQHGTNKNNFSDGGGAASSQ